MIEIEEAFEHYRRELSPLPAEDVELGEALGRALAAEVECSTDLPPFDQSAMDGYALRSEPTGDAAAGEPVRLELVGASVAGPGGELPELTEEQAMRIFTGAPLPPGADAVLRQEDARVQGGDLLVERPVRPGHNVRDRGEEVRAGATLARPGSRLSAGDLAALAVGGVAELTVRSRPRVALFVTGDELVPPGRALAPGQVYDGNRPLVGGWLRSGGYPVVTATHLPDDRRQTASALDGGLDNADLVVTTGGASVGEHDHVLDAGRDVGVADVFWKVRQKPGKPLYFGVRDGTPLLALPGNPGSAFTSLVTHVHRVLELLEGISEPAPRFSPGRLAAETRRRPDRDFWIRCRRMEDDGAVCWLEPLPGQASHMITNLGRCDALARLPSGPEPAPRGEVVPWTPCGRRA